MTSPDATNLRWTLWAIAALAVFGAAWATARNGHVSRGTHPPAAHRPTVATEGRSTAQLSATLDALHVADDVFTRLDGFVTLVGSCSRVELQRLAEQPSLTLAEWSLLVRRWAEIDPASLLELLKRPHQVATQVRPAEILFKIWFEHDPTTALAMLDGVAARPDFTGAVYSSLPTVFSRDPEAAFALLRKASADRERLPPLPDALWKDDPAGFISRIARECRSGLRSPAASQAALRALTALAETDPAAAMRLFSTKREALPREVLTSDLVSVLMQADPTGTAGWIASLPDAADRQRLGSDYAEKLAEKDPAAAIAHAQASLTGSARDRAISNAAHELPFDQKKQLAESTPPGGLRSRLVRVAAHEFARIHGADAAIDWVLSLPDRGAVAGSALASLASDPKSASKVYAYAKANPDDPAAVRLAEELIEQSSRNRDLLLRHAFGLPEELIREPLANQLSAYAMDGFGGYDDIGHAADTLEPAQIDYLAGILVDDVGLTSNRSEADEAHLQRYATLPPGALREAFLRKLEATDFRGDSARKEKVLSSFK